MIRIKFTNITPLVKFLLVAGVTLFPVVAIFFFLLSVVYFPTFRNMHQVVNYTMDEILPIVELENTLLRSAMPPNDFLIHRDKVEQDNFAELARQVEERFQRAIKLSPSAKHQAEMELAYNIWQKAHMMGKELLQSSEANSVTLGEKMEIFDATIEKALDSLAPTRLAVYAKIKEQYAVTMRLKDKGIFVSLIAFILALACGIMLSIFFTVDRRQLKQMSYVDELTSLFNRRALDKQLKYITKEVISFEKSIFAFLLLDIDHFKQVNDIHGHEVGDIVLRDVAKVIKKNTRSSDFASRYGGEEFALIVPTTEIDEVSFLAERIRTSVEETIFLVEDKKEIRITISIGCAFFPVDTKVKEKIFQCADQALYAAKEGGRNRVVSFASLPSKKIVS